MPQIILPVKYRTTKVYYQEQNSPDIRFDIFNFSSFRLEESDISANTKLTADRPFSWILSVYQDSQGTTTYTLARQGHVLEIFTQLPNYWLLKILSCKKHEHVAQPLHY